MLTGVLTEEHILPIFLAAPVLLIGVWAGSRVYEGMGAGQFGKLVFWALGAIGVFYILRGTLI